MCFCTIPSNGHTSLSTTLVFIYSQLYHACDVNAWSVYYWCVLPFNVLSHCDFFASILSFVVTMVAMAGLSRGVTSFVHTVNVLFLVLAVEWQQHSMMTFFVPTVFCLVVVVASRVSSCCCDLVMTCWSENCFAHLSTRVIVICIFIMISVKNAEEKNKNNLFTL